MVGISPGQRRLIYLSSIWHLSKRPTMRMRSGVFMLRMVLPRKESGKYCPLVNHLGANAIGSAVPSLFCFPQLVARVLSLRTSRNAWSQVLDINWGQSIAAGLQHVLVFSTLAANAVSAVWSCFILPAIAELRPSPHKMQFVGNAKPPGQQSRFFG